MKNQYEPLVTPAGWTGDEKRFAVRLTQILDELYERMGGVRKTTGTKLNASAVVDRLDVTDEGFVLDARMGHELADRIANIPNTVYPVGSIYLSMNEADPGDLFGGAWERIEDVFLLAAGDAYAAGASGGEAEVTLSAEQLAAHSHEGILYRGDSSAVSLNSGGDGYQLTYTSGAGYSRESDLGTAEAGGGEAHNNMPPYLAVYAWKRVE